MPDRANDDTTPGIPRRIILAAIFGGLAAGGMAALGTFGALTAPNQATFQFSRSTTMAAGQEDQLRAFLGAALQDDRVTVTVIGHSGTTGDQSANQDLSVQRAEYVRDIAVDMGIDATRISSIGVGGAAPLERAADQGERAWQAALARVHVSLQVRR